MPATEICPCRPLSTMPMTVFASPVTTGLLASGGNAPGEPCPCAPWQLAQLAEKTFEPLGLAIPPPADPPAPDSVDAPEEPDSVAAAASLSTTDSGGDAGAAACLAIVVTWPK